jgi:hypothetical protein
MKDFFQFKFASAKEQGEEEGQKLEGMPRESANFLLLRILAILAHANPDSDFMEILVASGILGPDLNVNTLTEESWETMQRLKNHAPPHAWEAMMEIIDKLEGTTMGILQRAIGIEGEEGGKN